jgi:hypothetical protein
MLGALALALPGCSVFDKHSIRGSGRLADTPQGRTAVLLVRVDTTNGIRTGQSSWGRLPTINPRERFAEILAHLAADEGGLDVMSPVEVRHGLKDAGLEFTLEPTEQQALAYARALGCSSYLDARVHRWLYSYIFFWAEATASYTITCHDVATGCPVWDLHVCWEANGMSDREVAVVSLREAFRWLKDPYPVQERCECPQ